MTVARFGDAVPLWPRFRNAVLKPLAARVPGGWLLVHAAKIPLYPGVRSEWRLQRERPDNLFQPFRTTSLDRYPRIFAFVQHAPAGSYDPVFHLGRERQPEDVPLYGRDDRRLPPIPCNEAIFRKRPLAADQESLAPLAAGPQSQ